MKISHDDIQISHGQARGILEIPGYRLHKPIEILLFNESPRYKAQHTLPSPHSEHGRDITGLGETEESAASHLISQLLDSHTNPANEMERNYLHSIMSRL